VDAAGLCGAFARELADRLASEDAAGLAAKTGLNESTTWEIVAGNSPDLLSWETVGTCVAAAELAHDAVARLRDRWVTAESVQWAERGPQLLHDIERQTQRARRQRSYDDKALSRELFSEYRPSAPWRKTPGSGHQQGPWRFEPWSSTRLLNDQPIPDPDRATSLSGFYLLLRQLYLWAGRPSYTEIE
jgi:hypothetical protein